MMRGPTDILIISKKRNFLRSFKVTHNVLQALIYLGGCLIIGTIMLMIFNARHMFLNMNIIRSEREHTMLMQKLDSLRTELNTVHEKFDLYIHEDNRQRVFWQMAHIHPDIWSMGVGGTKPLNHNEELTKKTRTVLEDMYESLDIIKGKCYLRNVSVQDIQDQVTTKYMLWSHIPSIHPVPGHPLGSGFGYRRDPINKKIIKMHWGVDIGAPRGTNIYAAADGTIASTGWNSGYGLTVDIDHGYGFRTRYAHCNSILVKQGDLVKRGQVIATVGSTGRTVAPHLHYEVHVSGVKVNPAPYIDQSEIVFD
ncbi:M23 family metallopeptidase [candidate division WOR-3 bacterium]|nr:M23 family metallopeptidase [candidate division WOR-3 bacterium]